MWPHSLCCFWRDSHETNPPPADASAMRTLRLLDLFCGAGGAGMGYHRAGLEVVGVDIKMQKNYPFEFHQADAFAFLEKHGHEFDVIHASPPCQAYSRVTPSDARGDYDFNTLPVIKSLMKDFGKPWILENVPGAEHLMLCPISLCGSMFGLGVWRHRFFEMSDAPTLTPECDHLRYSKPLDATGTGGPTNQPRMLPGGGWSRKPTNLKQAQDAMGIDWMTRKEISQAIPPAYTEWIGQRLLEAL